MTGIDKHDVFAILVLHVSNAASSPRAFRRRLDEREEETALPRS